VESVTKLFKMIPVVDAQIRLVTNGFGEWRA
jgi:hypothetical protein